MECPRQTTANPSANVVPVAAHALTALRANRCKAWHGVIGTGAKGRTPLHARGIGAALSVRHGIARGEFAPRRAARALRRGEAKAARDSGADPGGECRRPGNLAAVGCRPDLARL